MQIQHASDACQRAGTRAAAAHDLVLAALAEPEVGLQAWARWQAGCDWATLTRSEFCVLGAIYARLKHFGCHLPRGHELAQVYRQCWSRTHCVLDSAHTVLDALASAGIKAMVLKGIPLALFHYRDPGARSMADVDLLVSLDDAPTAMRVIRAAGWQPLSPEPPDELLPHTPSCTYVREGRVEIDLHWHPFRIDSPPESAKAAWDHAHRREFDGRSYLVPDAIDLVQMMCIQAFNRDDAAQLRWMLDSHKLMASIVRDGDAQALVRRCQSSGLLGLVADCCSLTAACGVPWPEFVASALSAALPEFEAAPALRHPPRMDPRRRDLRRLCTPGEMPRIAVEQIQLCHDVLRMRGQRHGPVACGMVAARYLQYRWQLAGIWGAGSELVKRVRGRGSRTG